MAENQFLSYGIAPDQQFETLVMMQILQNFFPVTWFYKFYREDEQMM